MVRFDLEVNGEAVTRVSILNKGDAASTDERHWCVYEWSAWRQDRGYRFDHAAGELLHCPDDGIEMLAIKVLQEYRSFDEAAPDLEKLRAALKRIDPQ